MKKLCKWVLEREREREIEREKGVVFSSPHKKTKKREKRVTKPTKTSVPPLLLTIFGRGKTNDEDLKTLAIKGFGINSRFGSATFNRFSLTF